MTTTTYKCVMMDPPWLERGSGKIKRGAQRHYALLSTPKLIETIAAAEPWSRRALDGCHVWLWAPSWRVATGETARVLEALGARPVRKLVWVKDWMGLGQYARGMHEDLVLGVIGKLSPLPSARSVRDVIEARHPRENGRRIHSAKPPEAYEAVEKISPGPRLELFSRRLREGWDGWGNEHPEESR